MCLRACAWGMGCGGGEERRCSSAAGTLAEAGCERGQVWGGPFGRGLGRGARVGVGEGGKGAQEGLECAGWVVGAWGVVGERKGAGAALPARWPLQLTEGVAGGEGRRFLGVGCVGSGAAVDAPLTCVGN